MQTPTNYVKEPNSNKNPPFHSARHDTLSPLQASTCPLLAD